MIFTTNSSYNPSYLNIVLKDPAATRFKTTSCFFYDFEKSRKPTAQIFCDVSVCDEDLDPLSFEKLYLLTKLPGEPKDGGTNGKWRINPDARKLDSRLMSMFNEKKKNPELDRLFKSAKKAGIEVLINTSRCYTRQNLANLLETHGFTIDTTFVLSAEGHITNEMCPPHVGVIAKYLK